MTEFSTSAGGILLPVSQLAVGGTFTVEHWRGDELLEVDQSPNIVCNEGLNSLLGVMFNAASQITTWYIGLFEANYTPVATVTAATITSASTECTAYDEAARVTYNEAAPASQSITNSANKATFTMNATKTVYGAFLVSASAKSATSGTLYSVSQFASSKAVVTSDVLLITYQLNAATA